MNAISVVVRGGRGIDREFFRGLIERHRSNFEGLNVVIPQGIAVARNGLLGGVSYATSETINGRRITG